MSIAVGLFNQSITSISREARDKWGNITHTTLYQNVPCRFSFDTDRGRSVTVETEPVDAYAYIGDNHSVLVDDLVVYDANNYLILGIRNAYDLFGNIDHKKLLLKSR